LRVQNSWFALQAAPDHVENVSLHLPSEVRLDTGLEVRDQLSHQLDIIVARERLGLQHSLAQLQPVARPDDATARDAGEHLHVAEDVALRETGQHSETRLGSAAAAARD